VHNHAPYGVSAQGEAMTSALAAFGMAVGGTSLICYALMTRLQNRRRNRPSPGASFEAGGGNFAGGDGWSNLTWSGGDHSATDCSGNPADSNGGDGGGGCDGGSGGD
jgi:hypothetical protein